MQHASLPLSHIPTVHILQLRDGTILATVYQIEVLELMVTGIAQPIHHLRVRARIELKEGWLR